MPPSSRFTFILEMSGNEALSQAKRWRQDLEREMAAARFEIAGLDATEKQLQKLQKLAAKLGASLFEGSDKSVAVLEERLAQVSSALSGIIKRPTQGGFVDQLTAQLSEASEAAGGLSARMVRSLSTAADEVRQLSKQIELLENEMMQLGSAPLLPRTVTGQAEPSRMEYLQARQLMDAAAATEAAGKKLSKAQQETIARVQSNDALMERALNKSYDQPITGGYDTLLMQEHDKSRQALERMKAIQREIEALAEKRIAAQQKLEKAKTPAAGVIELPPDAKGTLVDLTNAEKALGAAVQASLEPITSQTSRFGNNAKRLAEVAKAAQGLTDAEKRLGQSLGNGGEGALGNLPKQADQAVAATTNKVSGLVGAVSGVIGRLKGAQKGAFDPLTQEAQEASDKIVGHSIIPDMVTDVLHWLRILRNGEEDTFAVLGQDAQQAATQVNRAFSSTTGLDVFRANAAQFEKEMARIEGDAQRLLKSQEALSKMGVSAKDWAAMSTLDRAGTAVMAGEMQTWAVRNIGTRTEQYGREMMAAGTAALGSLALAGREYLAYAEPAQRAAANLQVEMSQVNDVLLTSTDTARKYFEVTAQAEGLYKWAAATGVVVKNQQQLQSVLDKQMLPVEQLQLMHSGELELGSAVDITSQILAQYNKRLDDTAQVTADLNAVAAYSQATVSDIGQAFSYVGDIADEMGVSFEETGSALQLLADRGQKGSRAGRGLAMALTDLVNPSEKAAAALDELFGRDYKKDLFPSGQFVGLAETIDLLAKKTATYSDARRQEALATIFDQNALRAILPLVSLEIEGRARGINVIEAMTKARQGQRDAEVEALEEMISAQRGYATNLESSQSIWEQMWADFEKSDVARAEQFKSRWSKAIVSIGQSAVQAGLPYLEQLAAGFERLANAARVNPEAVQAAMVGGGVIVALGALVSLFGKGIQIYADVKSITMAAQMMTAANQNVSAAVTMLAASQNMIRAAGLEVAAGQGGAVPGASPLFAGGGALGKAGTALGYLAVTAGAVYIGGTAAEKIANLVGPALYGKERWAEEQKRGWFERSGETLARANPVTLGLLGAGAGANLLASKGIISEADAKKAHELMMTLLGAMHAVNAEEVALQQQMSGVNAGLDASAQRWAAIGRAASASATNAQDYSRMVLGSERALDSAHLQVLRIDDATVAWSDGLRRIQSQTPDIAVAFENIALIAYRIPVALSLADQQLNAINQGWAKFTGLAGVMGAGQIMGWYDQYRAGLEQIYANMEGQEQGYIDIAVAAYNQGWDDRISKARNSSNDLENIQKEANQRASQIQQAFVSSVEGMLEPTQVTEADMAATNAGVYQDKWDEAARQMRAAMSDPNSKFRKMLIPEDVLAGGEPAIQNFGQNWLKRFYSGMMPDEVDWEAFTRDYVDQMQQKVGKQNLVQRAIEELAKRGITADKAEVQQALGITSPLQQMFFGGLTPAEAGKQLTGSITTAVGNVKIDPKQLTGPSTALVGAMSGGIQSQFETVNWVAMVVAVWTSQLNDKGEAVVDVGRSIGARIWDGMLDRLKGSGIVDHIVAEVLAELANEVEGQGKQGR